FGGVHGRRFRFGLPRELPCLFHGRSRSCPPHVPLSWVGGMASEVPIVSRWSWSAIVHTRSQSSTRVHDRSLLAGFWGPVPQQFQGLSPVTNIGMTVRL